MAKLFQRLLSVPQQNELGEGSIVWVVEGDDLIKFLKCTSGESILGPTISFRNSDVTLQLKLCPNGTDTNTSYGWRSTPKGRVQLQVGIKSAPFMVASGNKIGTVDAVKVAIELFCCETVSSYKSQITLYHDTFIGWGEMQQTLKECRKFKALHFGCNVELLQVIPAEYVSDSAEYEKNMKIEESVHKIFTIYQNQKLIYSADPIGKTFYGPSFGVDNNWCLAFTLMNGQGNATLSIKLLKLPCKIKEIKVRVCMGCSNITVGRYQKIFEEIMSTEEEQMTWVIKERDLETPFFSTNSTHFYVDVKILNVFAIDDYRNNKVAVPKYLWFKYGVEQARATKNDTANSGKKLACFCVFIGVVIVYYFLILGKKY